jgi:DEK C terminal domain
MGCYPSGAWRKGKEAYRARKYKPLSCSFYVIQILLYRMKVNLILGQSLSSPGTIMYVSIPFHLYWCQSKFGLQENELWDKESNHSIGSWVPPQKAKDGYESRTASIYGRETYYEPAHSRSYSPAPSNTQLPMYTGGGYTSGRNTPIGGPYLHQPAPSRPVTNYLDMPIPQSRSPDAVNFGDGQPTDSDIDRAVQEILRDADLNTVTKREIRRKLEDLFGVDLSNRKAAINATIDRVLLSHA